MYSIKFYKFYYTEEKMAGTSNNAITLTKQLIEKDDATELGLNKKAIINFFFRYESLVDDNNILRPPDSLNLDKIAQGTNSSKGIVLYILNGFFREMKDFHEFLIIKDERYEKVLTFVLEFLSQFTEWDIVLLEHINNEKVEYNLLEKKLQL